ncbi:unnamed protein product [Arabidopsis lyrata]|nr:unnamed protein product [Arabidopsis lyrata]
MNFQVQGSITHYSHSLHHCTLQRLLKLLQRPLTFPLLSSLFVSETSTHKKVHLTPVQAVDF